MDEKKNCTACNIKLDKNKNRKDRINCKKFYYKKKRKNSNNTLIQNEFTASHQQPNIKNFNINNENRTLIIGFSSYGNII